ncbi:MAG: CHAT domain-containing protein [Desulfovibrio sp.]|nr:CHAT domain-containing protein [Desulfovibrio sp.]
MNKRFISLFSLLTAAVWLTCLLLPPSFALAANKPGTRDLVYEEDEPAKSAPQEAPDRDLGPGPYYSLNKEQAKIVLDAVNQIRALQKNRQHAQALDVIQQLLQSVAKLPQPLDPRLNWAIHDDLYQSLKALGRYQEAEKVSKKNVALARLGMGEDSDAYAAAVRVRASILQSLDRNREAAALQEAELQRRLKKYGPADERTVGLASELIASYRAMNRYNDALDIAEKLLPFVLKKHGAASDATIGLRFEHAITLYYIGDYDAVEKECRELLAELKKAKKSGGSSYFDVLSLLGGAVDDGPKKDTAQALRLMEETRQGYAKLFGADNPHVLRMEGNCVIALIKLKEYAAAAKRLDALLPKLSQAYGEEHAYHLDMLAQRGKILLETGDADGALALLQDLLPRTQAITDKTISQSVYKLLCRACKAKGDLETSAFYGKQAVNEVQKVLRALKPDMRKTYAAAMEETCQLLADVLMAQGKTAEAQKVLGMLKGTELAALDVAPEKPAPKSAKAPAQAADSAPTDMMAGMDANIAGRYNEINNQIVALAGEQRALLDKRARGETLTQQEEERLKSLRQDMTTARKAFTAFMKNLSSELAKGDKRAADLGNLETYQRLLATLGDGVVLLQTIVTDSRIWLILTTPNSQVAKESPFDVKKLPEKITAFRDVLQDPEKDSRPLAKEFYEAVVGPLAPALEQANTKMIMFSLDGQLRYIPMAALHDGKQWLIQKYNVSLFNDATKAGLAVPGAGNWKVAGLGVTKEHKYGRGKFTALPAVKDELVSIVRTQANAGGVLNGVMTLDEGFTTDMLQDVLETGYPVIHLASHFHFDKKNPEQSFLLLGDGTGLPLTKIESEDFKFKNVDLLALSACQTARGGVDASGKEIEGFGALAQKRGAKAVLATLWPVFDESTGLLMSNFYRLHEGSDKPSIASALREAQLLMIDNKVEGKDFRQPFYWAPFVLMGDWR